MTEGAKPLRGAQAGVALLLLLGLVPCSGPARAADRPLTIYVSGHTPDWNPVNTQSYPALLVSRWISERLYERKCVAQPDEDNDEIITTIPVCQSPLERVHDGKVRIVVNKQLCSGPGGVPLSVDDVRYTITQINDAPYNEYNQYRLELPTSGVLLLGRGSGTTQAAVAKFDFPIFRRQGPGDPNALATRPIREGSEGYLNGHSAGPFLIASIQPEAIELDERAVGTPGTIDGIILREQPLARQTLETLRRPDRPDVVLGLVADFPVAAQYYTQRYSPDLDSFTYIGFNFGHPDFDGPMPPPQNALIRDQEFRKLFTQSLWAIDTIAQKVGIGVQQEKPSGTFVGEAFDGRGDAQQVDVLSTADITDRVQDYLRRRDLTRPVEMVLLPSPRIQQYFTEDELETIYDQIATIWNPNPNGVTGLKFDIEKRGSPKLFDDELRQGRFHLLFDDFVYGRSDLKQLAFVDPADATFNLLGIPEKLFSTREVARWRADPDTGMRDFRGRVAEVFPVAVIGQFPKRDLISTNVVEPRQDCGAAQQMPFFGVAEWTLKPGAGQP